MVTCGEHFLPLGLSLCRHKTGEDSIRLESGVPARAADSRGGRPSCPLTLGCPHGRWGEGPASLALGGTLEAEAPAQLAWGPGSAPGLGHGGLSPQRTLGAPEPPRPRKSLSPGIARWAREGTSLLVTTVQVLAPLLFRECLRWGRGCEEGCPGRLGLHAVAPAGCTPSSSPVPAGWRPS